jgi:hypothetical protein
MVLEPHFLLSVTSVIFYTAMTLFPYAHIRSLSPWDSRSRPRHHEYLSDGKDWEPGRSNPAPRTPRWQVTAPQAARLKNFIHPRFWPSASAMGSISSSTATSGSAAGTTSVS